MLGRSAAGRKIHRSWSSLLDISTYHPHLHIRTIQYLLSERILKCARLGRISGREYGELGVIDGRAWRYYTWFRNRDDKAAATFTISRLLSHHLPCEVPNEQQRIIWLFCHQLIRMA